MTEDVENQCDEASGDRRKHIRVPCRFEIESSKDDNWYVLYSKNIGLDGMMLSAETDIEKLKKIGIDVGEKVTLSFYLTSHSELTKVSGKIKHINRKPDPVDKVKLSIIGIQFEDLSEKMKKQLERFFFDN